MTDSDNFNPFDGSADDTNGVNTQGGGNDAPSDAVSPAGNDAPQEVASSAAAGTTAQASSPVTADAPAAEASPATDETAKGKKKKEKKPKKEKAVKEKKPKKEKAVKEKKPRKEKKQKEAGTEKKSKKGLVVFLCLLPVVALLVAAGVLGFLHYRSFEIEFKTKGYDFNEDTGCYTIPEDETSIKGTVSARFFTGVSTMTYTISDCNGVVILSGDINVSGDSWKISNPGFMLGKNEVTVTAPVLYFFKKSATLNVDNRDVSRMENVDISLDDTDGDGLFDYFEETLGTDINLEDTDKDGLTDFEEYMYTFTDATKYSSRDDGTSDYDYDSDSDGLINGEEVKKGTSPIYADTDGDELNDKEELENYKTDPLKYDTDEDGAGDGWEVANGYDPLTKQTSFAVDVTYTPNDSKISASVKMDVKGDPASVTIQSVCVDGLLDESTPGYMGGAFDFSCEHDFDSATISMTFDTSLAGPDSNLAIFYWNSKTQRLEEINTIVSGNTATAKVTHFSTYILLDKTRMEQVVQDDILTPDEIDMTPVQMAIVIDYSSSMNTNDPSYMRLAISKEFVSKLRENTDYASVVKYAGSATTLVPLSQDITMCVNAIDGISNADGSGCDSEDGTNGTDGIKHALTELEGSSIEGHKYVIFLTDGEDTTSSYNYDDLIAEAVQNNIVIFTVGMGSCNEDLLRKIAEGTGGKYHYASAIDAELDGKASLSEVFSAIGEDTIDYISDSNNDGISDYYTKCICEGKIKTGTGANPFGNATYEQIQASADFDGDGLLNGQEVELVADSDYLYLKYHSSPIDADTDGDGYLDGSDERVLLWDVGDRDLAIFAALTYEDASGKMGRMHQGESIVGNKEEPGETYYFWDYASLSKGGIDYSVAQNWVIVDYVNTLSGCFDYFSATTFKCQDNIVIAYRGTGNDGGTEITEWVDNIVLYGLLNHHSEEGPAKNYARKIAARFPGCKIYLTGHSLGGYLTQIGASELLLNTNTVPAGVAYFNGIGMNFYDHSGLVDYLKSEYLPAAEVLYAANMLYHIDAMEALANYGATHKLISYEIGGDVVSALGTHCGKVERFYATKDCYGRRQSDDGELITISVLAFLEEVTGQDLVKYQYYYGVNNFMDYMWTTHETDSFYYYLSQGTRSATGGSN